MNKILYSQRKKETIWTITFFVLASMSTFMLIYAPLTGGDEVIMFNSFFTIVLTIGVFYCLIAIYVNMLRIFKKKPALVLDETGMTINTSVDCPELRIEWKYVKFVTKKPDIGSIVAEIPSYTEIYETLPLISKVSTTFGNLFKTDCILKKEYYRGGNSGVVIRFALLHEKIDEVFPIVEAAFKEYKQKNK